MKGLITQALLAIMIAVPQLLVAQADDLSGSVRLVEQEDEGWVYAYVRAETEPIFDMDERGGISFDRDPVLLLVCTVGEVAVVYRFDTPLIGKDDAVRIKFRLDDQRFSKRQKWSLNHDPAAATQAQVAGVALGADNPILQMMGKSGEAVTMPKKYVDDFLGAARVADRMTVRVTDPIDGESHTDVFPLDGFGAAIDRLSHLCQG